MSDRIIEIKLPKLGESIVSATVVQWLKEEGDSVSADEPILEVSTDKVNSEIPAPQAGVLSEILVRENEEVDVGAPLAKLLTQKVPAMAAQQVSKTTIAPSDQKDKASFLSPAVINMARENNISLDVLTQLPGTGQGGRITKKDVQTHLENKNQGACPLAGNSSPIQKLPMGNLRKAIAENMVRSFYEAPHASLVAEVDVTEIMDEIKANKQNFLEEHGAKLSITSYLIEAIAQGAQQYPMVNASVEKDTIIMKKFVNLGVAVSVENGVMVPVIRNCHQKNISQIAKEVATLATKARENQLTQEDIDAGTITMTNFGMSGMLMGVPIIRHPEVAIVGIGSIQKKVMALKDNTIGIRQMVHLTLTFDHRIIDGIYGANFLSYIKTTLEKTK